MFRDGKQPYWFVKNGVTEMMATGFDGVVFSVPTNDVVNGVVSEDADTLYVRYRVSQPSGDGGRDINDGKYAMHVRFATCLRNAE